MSVIGIGIDLVECARIQHSIDRFGDRFLHRVFTDGEIAYSMSMKFPARHLAARFAAQARFRALGRIPAVSHARRAAASRARRSRAARHRALADVDHGTGGASACADRARTRLRMGQSHRSATVELQERVAWLWAVSARRSTRSPRCDLRRQDDTARRAQAAIVCPDPRNTGKALIYCRRGVKS